MGIQNVGMSLFLTHPNLGITPKNLQGHLNHSCTSVARGQRAQLARS